MKKVLSLLLAAVMLLSLCPTVFADDTIRANDTVEFGSYPQTMMTDEALIAALDGKVTAADARLILRASVGLENPKTWKKS